MSGSQRKWSGGHARWRIQWVEETTFKVEQEADNLTDKSMEEWTAWMDAQLQERFGDQKPRLVASSLNFSRNSLGDEAMRTLVDYLRGREIGVQTLKLFRNSIGDSGAWAIGKLMAHASLPPVHEVHLSHNELTEQGACSVLESVARSGRYPYVAEHAGRKDNQGKAPVWLRMEHNRINWGAIEHRLEQRQLRWCTADSRDGWQPKERAPMVCMHNSYRNQNAEQIPGGGGHWGGGGGEGAGDEEEPLNGQLLLAALQGDGEARRNLDAKLGQGAGARRSVPPPSPPVQPAPPAMQVAPAPPIEEAYAPKADGQGGDEAAEDNIPLYMFLDAGAVMQFLSREGVFSFEGLLNLCEQGHMKCRPQNPDRQPQHAPAWLEPVEERDTVMPVITDAVLEELKELAQRDPTVRKRYELLGGGQEPYIQVCLEWGILEILETVLHTKLMRLTPEHERLARDLGIKWPALKMLDFVSLWDAQCMVEGRVLLVTADEAICRFSNDARASGLSERFPTVVHYEELARLFAEDYAHGGHRLCEVALHRQSQRFCGTVLSAGLLAAIVGLAGAEPPSAPSDGEAGEAPITAARPPDPEAEAEALRQALAEAVALAAEARPLLEGSEASRCLERLDEATQRWRALLSNAG